MARTTNQTAVTDPTRARAVRTAATAINMHALRPDIAPLPDIDHAVQAAIDLGATPQDIRTAILAPTEVVR